MVILLPSAPGGIVIQSDRGTVDERGVWLRCPCHSAQRRGREPKMWALRTHPAPAPSFFQNLPVNHLFMLPRTLDWLMIAGGKQ